MLGLHLRKIFLFLGDAVLLYCSLLATVLLGFWKNFGWPIIIEHLLPFTILYIFWLLVFYSFSFYDIRVIKRRLYFYPKILAALAVNFFLGIIFFYAVPFSITPKTNLVFNIIFVGLLFVLWRMIFWKLFSTRFLSRVVIIGNGEEVKELKKEISKKPHLGYKAVSITLKKDLFAQISQHKIDTVIFTEEFEAHPNLLKAIYLCVPEKMNFLDFCQAFEIICQKTPIHLLKETLFLKNLKKQKKKIYNKLKRITDIIFAAIFLILSLPFWMLIALLIKLEDRGPVLYKQQRTGKGGKAFSLIKFRSMIQAAEKKGPQWADKQDKRITKIGKILRIMHLDELPQMLNILKGDISLVGPRPERPEFVQQLEKEIPHYQLRHLIKPGFTGWAQIKFQYARSVMDSFEKLQYDLYYIKNRSLFLDMGILLKTIQLFFRREQ